MKLAADQIAIGVGKRLFPVYLVCGDEPLQHGEALDAIRSFCKKSGYSNREAFDVEAGFSWTRFAVEARSLSLFAENKLLELRFGDELPDKKAQTALVNYLEHMPRATVLVLSCGKLEKTTVKSAWFLAVDRIGLIVQVWPLQHNKFLAWLEARIKSRGLFLDKPAVRLLASRVEGNMLAAAQEIEKLYTLYGSAPLDVNTLRQVVADSAHYDVFELVDSALAGQVARSDRILASIRTEGIAAQIVLWALARELRLLAKLRFELDHGGTRSNLYSKHAIWESRKALLDAVLKRLDLTRIQGLLRHCARIDRLGKGLAKGDVWEE
ncbi:MAG: DNA polymerase III subunit delta, partial [Methylococcales bacterium]